MTMIAVVDGFSSGAHLVRELVRRGAECIHVQTRRQVLPYLAASFEPADYRLDLGVRTDPEEVAEELARHGVCRVVAGSETGGPMADEVARLLGLPHNDPATVAARHSKYQMTRVLAAAGLAAPRSALVTDVRQACRWWTESAVGCAVVKPVVSAGSEQVRFCRTLTEVRSAVAEVLSGDNCFGDRNRTAVVQEALEGPELYVNTVSVGGRHHVVETWRYVKRRSPDGHPIFDYEVPADLSPERAEQVHEYVRRALTALGVANAAGHSEVICTANGPVLIDPGARLGGGVLPWLTERYRGHSHVSLFAASLLDPDGIEREMQAMRDWPCPVRYVSLINHSTGTAVEPDWVHRIERLPSCVAVATAVRAGQRLLATKDLMTSPGFVYLAGPSASAIEADYRQLRSWEAAGMYTCADSVQRTA